MSRVEEIEEGTPSTNEGGALDKHLHLLVVGMAQSPLLQQGLRPTNSPLS
jgi:hypothetical protein